MKLVSAGRKMRSLMVATALVLGMGVLSVGAQEANAAPTGCSLGATCLYEHELYKGRMLPFYSRVEITSKFFYPNTDVVVGRRTSSAFNNGRYETVRLYKDPCATGASITLAKGSGQTWGSFLNGWNDQVESGYFTSGSLSPWCDSWLKNNS